MVEGKITSPWAEKVNTASPLPEYPRPQMVRENWLNLNGLWDYAIRPRGEDLPAAFDGKILVPFAIESALSGVGKNVGKDHRLWYRRTVSIPSAFKKKTILLHFGAVDWQCDVYVNGKKAGTHQGGYDPFSIDISGFVKAGPQEILVSVWDPSDEGPQPRGKQVNKPHAIWYTPVTGIWQTVWLEGVPKSFIAGTKQTPDIDKKNLRVQIIANALQAGDKIKISAWDDTQMVAEQQLEGTEAILNIANPKLWSPANPFLYGLRVAIIRKGKVIDEVKSYFAMRKISTGVDNNGIQRMLLNNEFVFSIRPARSGLVAGWAIYRPNG